MGQWESREWGRGVEEPGQREKEGGRDREREWDFKNLWHVKIVSSYIQSYTHFNYTLIIKVCVCVFVWLLPSLDRSSHFLFWRLEIESSSEFIRQINGRPILREDLICHALRPRITCRQDNHHVEGHWWFRSSRFFVCLCKHLMVSFINPATISGRVASGSAPQQQPWGMKRRSGPPLELTFPMESLIFEIEFRILWKLHFPSRSWILCRLRSGIASPAAFRSLIKVFLN